MAPQVKHSHAHEQGLPGTVVLKAQEGDDTAYGQAIFPIPSSDPNDPLNWPEWKKNAILVCLCLYSFLGNWAIVGPSVYIVLFAQQFGVSVTRASDLISYSNLAFGFTSYVLVPAYLKVGRRPVLLVSQIIFCVFLLVAANCNTFSSFMAARVLHSIGSGVCEALPVQLVNDIFFLHERGRKLGYYTVCLSLGSTAPFFAGYMLNAGLGFPTFFYVTFAFAAFCTVLCFFIVEESMFVRNPALVSKSVTNVNAPVNESVDEKNSQKGSSSDSQLEAAAAVPERKTYLQQLKPWSFISDVNIVPFLWRPFTYLLVPACLWVILIYGIEIGIGAFAYSYTFPILIQAPPYNWSQINSGLISLANLAGYLTAAPLSFIIDRYPAWRTRKNGGIREAEMRLPVLIPACFIGPAGMLLYGFAAAKQLHWFAYFAGAFMSNFSAFFYFTVSLAYATDSYSANLSEMLVIMNLGKQAISFGLSLDLLSWILKNGYKVILGGAFTSVLLFVHIWIFPFILWGKKIRVLTNSGPLARLHKRSIQVEGETH
ncbi:putative MFS transporter [Atractiella rhizophila]|jgi:MFS family permease|nr:putative MFS transporter [Atractiella rhizophila]